MKHLKLINDGKLINVRVVRIIGLIGLVVLTSCLIVGIYKVVAELPSLSIVAKLDVEARPVVFAQVAEQGLVSTNQNVLLHKLKCQI